MEANDTNYPDPAVIAAANEASALYKAIVTSILESEAIYLEALSVMLQYMKAMKVTLSTVRVFLNLYVILGNCFLRLNPKLCFCCWPIP